MVYVATEKGMTQYDGMDDIRLVKARYIHSALKEDEGNIFIECLPPRRDPNDISSAYSRPLLSYDRGRVKGMSDYERMSQIGLLKQIRFPLPFHSELEFKIHEAILTSYRVRDQRLAARKKISYVMDDEEQFSSSRLLGGAKKATNEGASLVGRSGCGKSAAIDILLSRYPQVIMHETEDGRFPQIVWLVVSCVPNSNFSALYEEVGKAFDDALNNSEPVYAKEISRLRTLGEKNNKVKNLIECFSVGLLVLDECQLISFDNTKEGSFESLLNLANETKVAIAVVSTEDAEEKMYTVPRTARRLGPPVYADMYCRDREYFDLLVCRLFEYQWWDDPVPVTKDIADALFDVSHGVLAHLVDIYSAACYDYLSHSRRPKVNAGYFRDIAEKYYPGLENLLSEAYSEDNEEKIRRVREEGSRKIEALLGAARQKEAMKQEIENSDEDALRRMMLRHVTQMICPMYPEYKGVKVENVFNAVLKLKSAEGKSEEEIARMVLERLQKEPKKKVKKTSTGSVLDQAQMRNLLDIEGGDED